MSQTSVANESLILLGNKTLADIDSDTTTEATVALLAFDTTRKDLLRMHPWNFAITRIAIAESATAPIFRYTKAYPLPSDCLRVLSVQGSLDWKVERISTGQVSIICDQASPIYLKYVADITDDTKWDASFHKTFVYKLAADMSFALVPDEALRKGHYNTFLFQLQIATGVDGSEDMEDDWGYNRGTFVDVRSDYGVGE